jgi:caffeoyl-CoA O-methyltransferase
MRLRLFHSLSLGTVAPLLAAALLLGACAPSGADGPAPAGNRAAAELTPQVQAVLDGIRAADAGQLSTSPEDGRFLRMLVVSSGAKRAVEIGGASGYGAIWMGLGLRETGGSLVTIEYDPARARELQANIAAAGLDDTVRVVAGDAFKALPEIEGNFDLVFLDAWKPDYLKFFEMTLPRLDRGGLFVAHNVVNKRDEMLDFLSIVESHPDVLTSIVSPGLEGMSVSVKR